MAGLIIKCCATGIMGLIAIYFSIKYFKRYKLEKGADDEYWRNVIQWDLLYGKIFVGFAVGIFLLMIPMIFLSEHTLEQGIYCLLFGKCQPFQTAVQQSGGTASGAAEILFVCLGRT